MKAICVDLNLTLKGWFEYFKHSAPHVFESIDGYVRGRLRSILRHQTKRKGRASGIDQLRWPNTYFAAATVKLISALLQLKATLSAQSNPPQVKVSNATGAAINLATATESVLKEFIEASQ
jgi:hypothetical protein